MDSDPANPDRQALPAPIAPLARRAAQMDLHGGELLSLRACRQVLRRRRATVCLATVIVTILAALYAFKTKPVYQATARIEVDASTRPLGKTGNPSAQTPVSDRYLQTQVDILKSDNLGWRTITQLGLDRSAQFASRRQGAGAVTLMAARARRSRILAAFEKQLRVRLAPGSRIIQVSFEGTNPTLAQQIPNTLLKNYLQYNFTAQYQSTRQVSHWMKKELGDLKGKVEASQQALVNYEKQNDVADLGNRNNLNQNALTDLSRQLTAARTQLAAQRAVLDAVEQNPSAAGLLTKDSVLSGLQGKYGDLETVYAKALAQYGPNFYKVVRIRKQIDEVQQLIHQEQKREQAEAQANYRASRQRVDILASAVSEQKAQVQKFNQLQIPYDILKNDYQTDQGLYQSLLERLKNAEISAGLKATNVHVLDPAMYPVAPIRPKKTMDVAAGLLSGLLLGLTLAFVQDGLDNSVKRPEELEAVVGAPLLGVIPEAGSLAGGRAWLASSRGRETAVVERCVLQRPHSPIAEAYRALRTAILLSPAIPPPQVLLFTSAQPREGKTSTCANLALSLAQLNRRVLLIDADLRRGQIQTVFRLPHGPGLNDVLAGDLTLPAALVPVEDAPNLWVLASGSRPSSPADLLSSPMMESIVETLRQRFEFILIDSPPLLLVADPAIISKFADGIILVASSEATARSAVSQALRTLEVAGEKLLGAVVNRVNVRRDNDYDYFRRYRYYYSSHPADGASNSGFRAGTRGPGPHRAAPTPHEK